MLEYSRNWEFFLSDIRIITGTTLSFDLHILKQLAAPDSPLARLGRIAVRETTLSRMISDVAPEEKSFLDKATEDFSKKQKEISRNIGLTSEERMEKQLVDNRFAALREVVTGQSDTALPTADGSTNSSKQGLAGINGVINEFYTALVIADTAINTNIIPPSTNAASTKLILEGGKMPAPFREILLAIAKNGVENIKQGAAEIFRNQAQKQLDRLLNLLSNQLTDVCKRTIEGKYPFVDSNQEVEVEDFERMFAPDGIFDEVFKKQLLPFVDTSSRPWKYKSPDVINSESEGTGTSNLAVASMNNAPTLQGEFVRLLASQGPNLDIFARVAKLREVFFRGSAIKKYSWKMNIKIQELDPNINQFILDIDGQLIHYAHGPVQYQTVWWPGTKGGVIAELTANPRISNTSSVISGSGQWGIFRLIDKALIESTAASERIRAGFVFDSRKATLDIVTPGTANPLNRQIFKGFSCTGR